MKTVLAFGALLLTPLMAAAQQQQQQQMASAAPPTSEEIREGSRSMGGANCNASIYNCSNTPNPLPPANTVWIEEMTWMDVRDALNDGKRTVIIATGGVEPNGPWLVTGKHNYVLQANCEAIARELGDAVCAPVIPFVPEGNIEPPSSHMTSPGTISLREQTYRELLTDVARSMKVHGFKNIIFIGDSGGNQNGQLAVAQALTAEWASEGRTAPIAAQVREYYTYSAVSAYMRDNHGLVSSANDRLHDDPVISLNMFIQDPSSIRYDERVAAGFASINGVSIADRVQATEWARQIVDFRARMTADAIRGHIAAGGSVAPPPPPEGVMVAAGGGRGGGGGAAGAGGGRGAGPGGAGGGGGRGGGGGGGGAPAVQSMGGGTCGTSPQPGQGETGSIYNCPATPNPLPAPNTVWIEEMTWMDVRDALAAGKTTAIIATGGVEPNGPWLATGKHNYVNRANCDAIARTLGNALCAPLVKWVPEGNIDPPSSHMNSPGTISLRQGTFRALLTDIAHSLRMHGFTNIVFIGDSGGNQGGQLAVADSLNQAWGGAATVAHIPEYYQYGVVSAHMRENHGLVRGQSDGLHDDPTIALNMFFTDPATIRYEERLKLGLASIDGVSLADRTQALRWAQQIVDFRANHTADAIRRAIAHGGTLPVQSGRGGGAGG